MKLITKNCTFEPLKHKTKQTHQNPQSQNPAKSKLSNTQRIKKLTQDSNRLIRRLSPSKPTQFNAILVTHNWVPHLPLATLQWQENGPHHPRLIIIKINIVQIIEARYRGPSATDLAVRALVMVQESAGLAWPFWG
jgi:hypothetical protein